MPGGGPRAHLRGHRHLPRRRRCALARRWARPARFFPGRADRAIWSLGSGSGICCERRSAKLGIRPAPAGRLEPRLL